MQINQMVKRWTEDEDSYIKEHYLQMSDKELSQNLPGRTSGAVKSERQKLNLYRPRKSAPHKSKGEKPTFIQVKKMFEEKGYILISAEDEYSKQSDKLRYICPKHENMGEQVIDVYHLKTGRGCYYCGRERTNAARKSKVTANDDRKLCELKGFEYIDTQIVNGIPYIFFICPKHRILGIQKMQRGNMNRSSVKGCQYCNGKNLPHWYVKHIIESKYDIEVLSEYKGMNKNITCRCKIHDEIFTTLAKYVFHDGSGCSICGKEKIVLAQRLPLDEVERRILEKNPDVIILNLDEYQGYDSIIKLQCKKCGNTWEQVFSSIVSNSVRCPNCQRGSLGELEICSVLIKYKIMFQPQYKFEDCRGRKRPCPFDFAILDNSNNVLGLIEYQGEQHYHPVKFFGGMKKFKEQVARDKIKKDYCDTNNIPLLVIPYWDFSNINDLVIEFINNIK